MSSSKPGQGPQQKLFPTVLDPVMVPLARVYAEALFSAAEKAGQVEVVRRELDFILDELFAQHPEVEQLLRAAALSPNKKAELIDRVFGPRFHPLVVNLLKVLNRRHRLALFRTVVHQFRLLQDERAGIRDVIVRLAFEPDEPLRADCEAKLAALVGGKPRIHFVVDPALLGGLVVEVDHRVYDGSLRSQLERLQRRIVERSRHEIQSGRDRLYS